MATIASMTPEDLKKFVEDQNAEPVSTHLRGAFALSQDRDDDTLSWEAIRASVALHRWYTPTTRREIIALVREDRVS